MGESRARGGQEKYAVKVVELEGLSESVSEQIQEELTIMSKLDHRYVAKLERAYRDQHYIYIVMKLINGTVLLNEIEERGFFSEVEAAKLLSKILEGIQHMHSRNIIHRDLKPENIMLDQNSDPVIIDFGLSKDSSDPCTVLNSFVGSKMYMAPEILRGEQHSYPCDLWAVGIMMFIVLSG